MAESKSMRVAYGEALRDIGGLNEKVVVCDADLAHATMAIILSRKLSPTESAFTSRKV